MFYFKRYKSFLGQLNVRRPHSYQLIEVSTEKQHTEIQSSTKRYAPLTRCLLAILLTTLAVVPINGADCLTSNNYSARTSMLAPTSDRVHIIKSAATNHETYKQSKSTFKEVFDKLTIKVKENTPIGSKLADIQAQEEDSQDTKIMYAIVGGSDAKSFNLTVDRSTNRVELVNEVELDYESSKRSYHIIIRATSLFLRYEVDVDILVTDENDNKPQLEDFTIVLNNYKNYFPNLPIAKVPATDADVDDQSRLRYRVLAGNNAQLIVVNETTGDIQLSPWLNSNVPMKAVISVAVSDGLNEAVAQLVLKVNLVTEAMLQNSVVVRFDGIGRDEFLSKKYEVFLKEMVRTLGLTSHYSPNNIVILNVEEFVTEATQHESLTYRPYNGISISNASLSLNVTFSARADGNDLESYLSRQLIEERFYYNKETLMQTLNVNIAPPQDNPCQLSQEGRGPCPEYQECQAIHKFESAPKTFFITKNMIFRPIKAVQSFTCSCRTILDGNSSVCGPCNCDVSKGFSEDCDRLTGQCYCKTNHFQLIGSEFCLPCDCYSDGSLGLTCNQTVPGQCKCRPGVVGRRCDTCSSPYAEVTLRGCEVIYDACPKTFNDGIWWARTQLDKVASQQCPSLTSSGTATRVCHKTEGWLKANLFDCISNTFTNLYNQFQVLEDKKFPLTLETAIKIASDLRFALNETITNPSLQLYGSDMYIGFRLIHHLIQYQSQNSGLNLTHRQDRLYVRNIAESINYLLDPKYAENWPEIAARSSSGGAEYILKLIDTYGRILIESQSDTFTQPFEISTKWFTFGMDTLSAEQIWDLSRTSTSFSNHAVSPPYATDPYNSSLVNLDSPGADALDSRHQFNPDGSSIYLDYSIRGDASPAIAIPKYDNYQADQINHDDITKALLPLKTIKIRNIQEMISQSNFTARSRAKRDDLVTTESLFTKQQPALVVYSIYRSLGPLLPNHFDNTVQHRLGTTASPNSPVVWLTVRPANGSDFLSKNIQPKITYMLKVVQTEGMMRPQCAVWDFNPQVLALAKNQSVYGIKQTGKFSTKGCEIRGIHPNSRLRFKYDYVNCSCDHIGAVTVLMDNANYDSLTGEDTNFKDLSLCISLIASLIIMTIVYFVLSFVRGHSIKSNSNSINKNLVFILILFELLILYTVYSRSSLNQREYQCKLAAIFLHYLSISLFFWLLVNAIHFYRMLTELKDINHGPMKFYHVIGYAIPALFVSIAVGLRIEQFGNYLFCWLSIHEPIIWSMFGPISVVTTLTILMIILAFCKTIPLDDDPSGTDLLKNHMLINIIKSPLIGIYWLVTVFAVNESITDLFYIFPTMVLVKSMILFALLIIVDKHIRYNLYVSWLRFRGENAPFMEDTMNYSPNQWMPSMVGQPGSLTKNQLYAGYGGQAQTPGFQSSCTDIFRPDVLAFSAASTTSRSSVTGSSSAAYRYQHRHREDYDEAYGRTRRSSKHRRRHKKSHHKHHHHRHHHHHHHKSRHHNEDFYQYEHGRHRYESTNNPNKTSTNESSPLNELASSHSSDEDMSIMPKKDHVQNISHQKSESLVEKDEAQQTVPMEVSGPSISGRQTPPTTPGDLQESAQTKAT